MKLAIGCDEAAFELKQLLKMHLETLGHSVDDFGTHAPNETVMYCDTAFGVAEQVAAGVYSRAILLCGTGIGVCIAANKVPGVRAAQAHDTYSATRARKSNDAQILCLGARVIGPELARSIVDAWMASEFEGGRSSAKVERIVAYETQDHTPKQKATSG